MIDIEKCLIALVKGDVDLDGKWDVYTNLSGHYFLVFDEKVVMDFDCILNVHILDFIVIELQSGAMLALSNLGLVEVDLQD